MHKFNVTRALVASVTSMAVSTMAAAQTTPQQPLPSADKPAYVTYQAAGEARVSKVIGIVVRNASGEIIGDVNDLVVQETGQISTVIIGVGGFLGMGEKNVGVPFASLKIIKDANGMRSATFDASKAQLLAATSFVGEKTMFESVQDGAIDIAKAAQKSAKDMMKSP